MEDVALVELLPSCVLDMEQDQLLSGLRFDAAGVEHHDARSEMREVVAHFEVFHQAIVGENFFQQFSQSGNIPLPIAEVLNRTLLGFVACHSKIPIEGRVGALYAQVTV